MSNTILKKYDTYFLILCLCFSISGLLSFDKVNASIRLLFFPVLIIYYYKVPSYNSKYLLFFLIFFAFAEICYYFAVILKILNPFSYLGNIALSLGYTSIITLIFSRLNIKLLIKRFTIQILILGALGIYLFFELNEMVFSGYGGVENVPTIDYITNLYYNFIIILLLGVSLLNYFYHDSVIALKLLLACVILIFSEFVQTAFYFIETQEILSKIYIVLLAISYFIFFLYIKAEKFKPKEKIE